MKTYLKYAPVLSLIGLLFGCGGGSSPPPGPTPNPGVAVITNLGITDRPADTQQKQEISQK